jgi:hypothetical protein
MNMEFIVQVDGKNYEISELVTKVSYRDSLNNGCSKLEFTYINDDLVINNGSVVRFKYGGSDIFYGFVFKYSRDKGKEIKVTAYDQLRYCKAKDTINVKGDTVATLVRKMCFNLNLKYGTLTDSGYILPTSPHYDKTWLDILYSGIADMVLYEGKKYALRDEFGKIALRDLEDLRQSLVLGDGSLVYDFSYDKSIDDEFYNQVKLVSRNDASGKDLIYKTLDSSSIGKFGLLQYYEKLDNNANDSQARFRADQLLKLYNREVESLNLKCLGDTNIRAGTSFYGLIGDIDLGRFLIVKEATHDFLPNHTMSLEVFI